jgi:hypothetical protein
MKASYLTFLRILTPLNLREEGERFLASSTYHPTFTYEWDREELDDFVRIRPYMGPLVRAIEAQDADAISREAGVRFETTMDTDALAEARTRLLKFGDELHPVPVPEIAAAFQRAFDFFGIDYTIRIVDKPGFYFRPFHDKRVFLISATTELQFFTVDGALKHELTHILRYLNTIHNGIVNSPNYLPTEEGLASFMQDTYGDLGERSLFQHAAEYVATDVGLKGSLRDVYDFFREQDFSPTLAWQRAARHKFGFVDTSLPGDIMKPSMYYFHERRIAAIPEADRWKLFVGKVAERDLPGIPEYRGAVPLDKLREFYATLHADD